MTKYLVQYKDGSRVSIDSLIKPYELERNNNTLLAFDNGKFVYYIPTKDIEYWRSANES